MISEAQCHMIYFKMFKILLLIFALVDICIRASDWLIWAKRNVERGALYQNLSSL